MSRKKIIINGVSVKSSEEKRIAVEAAGCTFNEKTEGNFFQVNPEDRTKSTEPEPKS